MSAIETKRESDNGREERIPVDPGGRRQRRHYSLKESQKETRRQSGEDGAIRRRWQSHYREQWWKTQMGDKERRREIRTEVRPNKRGRVREGEE